MDKKSHKKKLSENKIWKKSRRIVLKSNRRIKYIILYCITSRKRIRP